MLVLIYIFANIFANIFVKAWGASRAESAKWVDFIASV